MEEQTDTAVVKISPGRAPEIIVLCNEAFELREFAEARVITEVAHLTPATEDLSIIARLKKALEEKRKEYIKPLQDHVKAINDAFKFLMEPIEVADQVTRKKILAFQAEQERIRQEQERINALRIEAAKKEMELKGELTEPVDLVEVIPEAPDRVETDLGASGMATIWKFEVVDFALLPDRFKMENATLIGKVVRAGEREIPGVRIWSEKNLRVTTK